MAISKIKFWTKKDIGNGRKSIVVDEKFCDISGSIQELLDTFSFTRVKPEEVELVINKCILLKPYFESPLSDSVGIDLYDSEGVRLYLGKEG